MDELAFFRSETQVSQTFTCFADRRDCSVLRSISRDGAVLNDESEYSEYVIGVDLVGFASMCDELDSVVAMSGFLDESDGAVDPEEREDVRDELDVALRFHGLDLTFNSRR